MSLEDWKLVMVRAAYQRNASGPNYIRPYDGISQLKVWTFHSSACAAVPTQDEEQNRKSARRLSGRNQVDELNEKMNVNSDGSSSMNEKKTYQIDQSCIFYTAYIDEVTSSL